MRPRLIASADSYRRKHPERDLWVPFWPKAGLAAYQGMDRYDPRFGEAFYEDSIRCRTLFLKAKTQVGETGSCWRRWGRRTCGAFWR